jgi:DNA-binding MarR family transcriptional regulator
VPGAAFLLSQLGIYASRLWAQRIQKLGLDPRHVMLLGVVAAGEGRSQQALGEQIQRPPSRMVAFVDELENRRLVERRSAPDDRRVRAIHVTDEGLKILDEVMRVSAEFEAEICAGLTKEEQERLIELLSRIVTEQGLAPGVHPGIWAGGVPQS